MNLKIKAQRYVDSRKIPVSLFSFEAMKKIIALLFILIAFQSVSQTYSTVKVGPEEKISFKIPSSMTSMTDQDRMSKIYSSKVPLAMYADDNQEATFGVNYNTMQWTERDTEMIHGFYEASINNLFDKVTFTKNEIKEINGKDFIIFEFIGEIQDDNVFSAKSSPKSYSYIVYTSWKDQVLLFNFSCKARLSNQWNGVAKEIIESIKIK